MLKLSIRHRLPDFMLNASFEAPSGVTALFGRSGAGKSTIVNAVAGLMRPDSGRIEADGIVMSDSRTRRFLPPHRRRMGCVFQDARLFPHLTVRQNLFYGAWFAGRQDITEQNRIIELLGIGHLLTRQPGTLSGGERQRVALGRAILSRPRLLLMDEPLAALDEARKSEILPYLERLRDETKLPILYVSHSPAEVIRLATTMVLLDSGQVISAGPTSDVMSDPAIAPVLGLHETGAILKARVLKQEHDGLTCLTTSAGNIYLPGMDAAPGTFLRLRILAQDVMIALDRPSGISALNILPGTIHDMTETDSGVLLRLICGQEIVLARITRRSARALQLQPGKEVHAVLKAVSVAPGNIGTYGQENTPGIADSV